ncbi:hypothetical protein ACA910_017214 [Epithemia clementina (nom. ined.)]
MKRGGASFTSDPPSENHSEPSEELSSSDIISGTGADSTGTAGAGDESFDDTELTSDDAVEEQLLVDDPTIDEDSSANVDRMEYADAYDEEEEDSSSSSYGGSPEYTYTSSVPDESSQSITGMDSENHDDKAPTIQLSHTITEDMKKVMIKNLKYKTSDLEVIRPEIASIIVAKDIDRPMEGLPLNWYKDGLEPKQSKRIIRKILVACAVAALAIAAGSKVVDVDLSILTDRFSLPRRKSVPLPLVTPSVLVDQLQQSDSTVGDEVDITDHLTNEASEEKAEEEEEATHSVRPGEAPSRDLDELWLDKVITAIISGLQKLLRL